MKMQTHIHLILFLFIFFSITSFAQAPWSDPATWANLGMTSPQAGDEVTIPIGAHILLDEDTPDLGELIVAGTLSFDYQNLTLTADRILVTGTFEIGTLTTPFTHQATITLNGTNTTAAAADRGIVVMGGNLELHGNPPTVPWTKLNAHAPAGSTNLTLMESVTWSVGDQIVVAPTDYYTTPSTDLAVLSAVSGTNLTIPAPGLNGYRWGQLQYATTTGMSLTTTNLVTPPAASGTTPTALDERAPVGNLTRNILIRSPDDALWQNECFGVHIMIMRMGTGDNKGVAHVNGVEIRRGGQEGNVGRYPFHWHMLSYEDCADLSGNCQTLSDATGQYISNSTINQSCFRGIVIHGTNGVNVSNNILYDVRGHGIMTEDAAERRNTVTGNLVLHVRNSVQFWDDMGNQLSLNHETGNPTLGGQRGASGFWISNPDNTFQNNTAADCQTNGFWLAFSANPWRLCRYAALTPVAMTFGVFANNTAHSNRLEGIMLDFREIQTGPGNIQAIQYFSTSDGVYPSAPWSTVQRFEMPFLSTWKNGSRGLWDRTAAIDIYEVVSADNCGRFFAGSGAAGVIERSLVVGTSLNYNLNGVTRPTSITDEITPAAFATYHSAFSIRDNIIMNFSESANEMSGAFATNDYYLRPVEKGHIRSPNNLLIASHPGVKLEAAAPYFTLASALWDPNMIWGSNPENYLVYDVPFLTHGQTPSNVPPGTTSGGVLVEGPFYGIYEFVVNQANDRNNDLMEIEVNRLDDGMNVVGTWTVAEGVLGQALIHMRDFAAHPMDYYTLEFPGITDVTDVGLTIENMSTTDDTLILAIEFSGDETAYQVYSSSRYTYFDPGHSAAPTYAYKHVYHPVGNRQAVIDYDGEAFWQDTQNDLVWIKVVGGIDQESWNPANFTPLDDELLYWEFYLRVTQVQAPGGILPIELMNFDAAAQPDKTVKLTWATATEIDNAYFQIQRSANGTSWTDLKKIIGAGNSASPLDYFFIDTNPLMGTSYYRLKQVDLDGIISYSLTESVYFGKPRMITVSPNPVQNLMHIHLEGLLETGTLEIIDPQGKPALPTKLITLPTERLNTSTLEAGLYFLRIVTEVGVEVVPFVKQ